MDRREIGINTRNWVDSAKDRDYWRTVVNAVLNLRLPQAMKLIVYSGNVLFKSFQESEMFCEQLIICHAVLVDNRVLWIKYLQGQLCVGLILSTAQLSSHPNNLTGKLATEASKTSLQLYTFCQTTLFYRASINSLSKDSCSIPAHLDLLVEYFCYL